MTTHTEIKYQKTKGKTMTTYAQYKNALYADRKLTSTQKAVAGCIAHHADWKTGQSSHPGNKLIAEETGLSEVSVKRAVPELINQGWLYRTYNGQGASSKKASEYALKLPDQSISVNSQGITESVQGITEDSSRYHCDTTSTSITTSVTTSSEEKTGRKARRKITERDLGLSPRAVESPRDLQASSAPENARTYTYWEKDGSWLVFPVAKVKYKPKNAAVVSLSVDEDEFYREYFRGGKDMNEDRVDFLQGSPEYRARGIEAVRAMAA